MTPALAEPGFAHLLRQHDHWATRDDAGRLVYIRLDDMGDHHRRRVLALIRELAVFLHRRELADIARRYSVGQISIETFGRDTRFLEALDPHVWLDETALVRRLVQLTPNPPALPRRRRRLPWRLR